MSTCRKPSGASGGAAGKGLIAASILLLSATAWSHAQPQQGIHSAVIYHCADDVQMLVERSRAEPEALWLTWDGGSQRLTLASAAGDVPRYVDAGGRLSWIDMPQQALLLETGEHKSRILARACRR